MGTRHRTDPSFVRKICQNASETEPVLACVDVGESDMEALLASIRDELEWDQPTLENFQADIMRKLKVGAVGRKEMQYLAKPGNIERLGLEHLTLVEQDLVCTCIQEFAEQNGWVVLEAARAWAKSKHVHTVFTADTGAPAGHKKVYELACSDQEVELASILGELRVKPTFEGAQPETLQPDQVEALQAVLEKKLNQGRLLQALYPEPGSWLRARIVVSDIQFLHTLRAEVLEAHIATALQSVLPRKRGLIESEDGTVSVELDLSSFAELYEATSFRLDKLTAHQQSVMEQCHDKLTKAAVVHLKAAAGAGKTFVGLHLMLERLRREARVLFVAHTKGLVLFVAKWLWHRAGSQEERVDWFSRVHWVYSSEAPQRVDCESEQGRIQLLPLSDSDSNDPLEYSLTIVDEAHHVYQSEQLKSVLAGLESPGAMLLLSDSSQCGEDAQLPAAELQLTEVVRSTQRIVAGAMSFQSTDHTLTQSHCLHEGPPLKPFLFDAPADVPSSELMAAFATETVRALEYVVEAVPSLWLHGRLAILVPDETFRSQLVEALVPILKQSEELQKKRLQFVTAAEGSSIVSSGREREGAMASVVLDSLDEFDGLERLFVVAVGLDHPVEGGSSSVLYRAITRAQMMFVLVDRKLPGGWLEWLLFEPKFEAGFDQHKEAAYCSGAAAARPSQSSPQPSSSAYPTTALRPQPSRTERSSTSSTTQQGESGIPGESGGSPAEHRALPQDSMSPVSYSLDGALPTFKLAPGVRSSRRSRHRQGSSSKPRSSSLPPRESGGSPAEHRAFEFSLGSPAGADSKFSFALQTNQELPTFNYTPPTVPSQLAAPFVPASPPQPSAVPAPEATVHQGSTRRTGQSIWDNSDCGAPGEAPELSFCPVSSTPQPFTRLRRVDANGDLLQYLLKHLAPPRMPNPAVLWRCAKSARFLWEAVTQMESPGGQDPELEELRAWKALTALWEAGEHRQATDVLIRAMVRCSPGATEEGLRKWLEFNGDGTLDYWGLDSFTTGFKLVALPEEFGTVRTTGDLYLRGNRLGSLPASFGSVTVGKNLNLHKNQLGSLPESFGSVTVGGDLFMRDDGYGDMGPAVAEASKLRYPNVKGEVMW